MSPALQHIVIIAALFPNAISAARCWHKGQPGWAGVYATGFTCCVLYLQGAGR